ncbi:sentrin-specific protease 6-like isoform X5 [Macrobrachium rosenbergii]|uniref:sentrin-specific protease 6-like isoform X5 n=1 Tax=Macrobrachium rosenbergii TaxID=79674 RepID=UPI0034D6320F
MDDQQLIVIPDGKGEVTLLDTEGGILVEHGEYSVTIPSGGQHVTQAQTQQHVVYTTQQAVVQPRVVYSPQPQQVYQVASAHPQQVTGIPQGRTIIASSGPASNEIQQQAPDIQIQNASPSKKLSLTEYRSRQKVSQDLKQQQQQTTSTTIVAQATPHGIGEEVRMVPVSVNANNRQQYCFLQQSDGKKFLYPVDMNMKVSICTPSTATSATTTISKPPQLAANNSPVLIVKQDGEGMRSSSSPVQPQSSLNSPSPSPTKIITSGISTTKPPIQEQTIHSTASPEESDKEQSEKPVYVQGRAALCSHCGILSEDLVRCQRCNFRLPANVRTMSHPNAITSTKNNALETQVVSRGVTVTTHVGKQTGGGLKRAGDKRGAASPAQKPKGRCRGRGKIYEEPEIVSLSSDEDEDKKPSSSAGAHGVGVADGRTYSRLPNRGPPEPISHKEPIITEDMENFEDAVEQDVGGPVTGGGLPDIQSITDGTLKGPYTSIHCRSIRIGSYKVMPRDRMLIMPQGIKIKVPSILDNSSIVTFDIPIKSIVKVLAHFGKSLPVFFLYLKPSLAESIRRTLKMTDKNGLYFDPCSYDEAHKRITILPDRMTDETKMMIKDILTMTGSTSKGKLEELDIKEANEILIRSSPTEVQTYVRKPVGSSPSETKTIIIYPPPPQKGGISITTDDYACLEEEQFLNDVIIDFYLKWLLQSKLSEIHRTRTHVFSTFFYKRLTSKPKKGRRPHAIEDDPKLSAAEKRHARVKSWTKNVDIFEKDFIVIPINEHAHWFLAIICYPGLSGPIRISDGQPISRTAVEKPRKRRSTRPRNRIEQIPIIDDGEWSDRDEAEGEEDELEEDDEEEDPPPNKKSKVEGEPPEESDQTITESNTPQSIRQPCILIFDSLSGANRVRIVATLRDYLTVEHKVRKNSEKLFNRDTMKGACPRVPQQMNYSDCGIYTLQFAESFFEHPLKDYTFPIRTLGEWFPQEVVRGKREAIARLIKSLMEQHNPNHESIVLPDISFGSEDRKDASTGSDTATPVTSSENKLPQPNQDDEEVPSLERDAGETKYDSSLSGKEPSDGIAKDLCDGSESVHGSSKLLSDECKSSSHVLKMSDVKDEGVHNVPGSTVKVVPNMSIAENASETLRKPLVSVSRIGSGGVGHIHSKGLQQSLKGPLSSLQEKRNTIIYESDEDIFPKREKKKVAGKGSVVSGNSLTLLQEEYCDEDDLLEGDSGESSNYVNMVGNSGLVRVSSNNSSTMKVERVVYMSEKNGVSEQMVSQVRTVKQSPATYENKAKLINGTFERGNQMVQMVPSAQGLSATNMGEIGKDFKVHSQMTSISQKQSLSVVNNTSFTFRNVCSKSSLSTTVQSMSQRLSSQHQKHIDVGLPVSSTSNYMDSDSGVKTVETSGGTSIIDEDTEEVLFIMPVVNNTGNQSKSRLQPDDEGSLSGSPIVRTTPLSVQDLDVRSVGNRRLAGVSGSPPRAGSSSPTFSGSQSVFRLSERVSSSGRTIAPPKRYLEEDDEVFQKKRRDKPIPGKTRVVR